MVLTEGKRKEKKRREDSEGKEMKKKKLSFYMFEKK